VWIYPSTRWGLRSSNISASCTRPWGSCYTTSRAGTSRAGMERRDTRMGN